MNRLVSNLLLSAACSSIAWLPAVQASPQSTPLATTAITLSMSGTGVGSLTAAGGIAFTITGTATLTPLGTAAVTGDGVITSLADLTSATPVSGHLTFTFPSGDTILATFLLPSVVFDPSLGGATAANGSIAIVGGTGKYTGSTGSIPSVTGSGTAGDLTKANFQLQGGGTINTPQATPPVITGIANAGAFGGAKNIAPGTWIEIFGVGLSTTTREWGAADFTNNGQNAPISLDGVKVTVGSQSAFVRYVSPTQVNALVPSSVGVGPTQITVSNANGTTAPYSITVDIVAPGLLVSPAQLLQGKQYVSAFIPNTVTYAGTPANPVKAGDTIILYGIGFGQVVPEIDAGLVASLANSLVIKPQFLFGTTPAVASYYGLAPGFTSLYQFNIVVPAVPSNLATPLIFDAGGVGGTQTLYIAVQ